MEFYTDLHAAIAAAREAAEHSTDGAQGLSAQRRNHGDGEYTWAVAFDADPTDGLTIMDEIVDCEDLTDAQIAAKIMHEWYEAWDEHQIERPVGDFTPGSIDWK